MTTLANPSGVCVSHPWEKTSASCAHVAADCLHQVWRGAALGLIGLTVVLAAFTSIVAITELRSDVTPTVSSVQIQHR